MKRHNLPKGPGGNHDTRHPMQKWPDIRAGRSREIAAREREREELEEQPLRIEYGTMTKGFYRQGLLGWILIKTSGRVIPPGASPPPQMQRAESREQTDLRSDAKNVEYKPESCRPVLGLVSPDIASDSLLDRILICECSHRPAHLQSFE